jgi:hypothetical protein
MSNGGRVSCATSSGPEHHGPRRHGFVYADYWLQAIATCTVSLGALLMLLAFIVQSRRTLGDSRWEADENGIMQDYHDDEG